MNKAKSAKRGRPANVVRRKTKKNKSVCVVKKRKVIKLPSKVVSEQADEYDFSRLRQDHGYVSPKENDIYDELNRMEGFQFHSKYE